MNRLPAVQDRRAIAFPTPGRRLATPLLAALALLGAMPARADLARVGPANVPAPPGHGFPFWYQDLTGLVLDLCLPDANDPGALQQTACLLGPPNPPYVFPTNFPDEAFYYRAVSAPLATGPATRAVLVLALEAAFGSGAPAAGQQMVFTRIRVTAGVPADGDYKVVHPYGTEFFPGVVASGGNRDIFFTEDVGITPGAFAEALTSRVGPFLQASLTEGGAPKPPVTLNGAQFLSDGVATELVTGSPFTTNYFQICGPLAADGSGPCVTTNLFSLTGRLRNLVANPIGSPLTVERATYARDASGSRVDVSASASAGVGQATPKLSAGGLEIPPVLMNGPTLLGEYYAQGIPVPAGAVPQTVMVTNSADAPPSSVTAHILDEVTVLSATYDAAAQTLTVVATTSDKGAGTIPAPALALDGLAATRVVGTPSDPAQTTLTVASVAVPPPFVRVISAAGGQGRMDVSMTNVGTFPAGVPFAQDDLASATQSGAAVIIPVLANDVFNPSPAAPGTAPTLVGPAPALGTATVLADGTVRYLPGLNTGTDTFRYTVSNAVGASNVAIVTVNVVAGPGGPIPTANADGPVNATTNTSVAINVLANDNGNGGTLDPASVTVVPGSVTGGTAVANPATGTITYTAGAAAGAFGFSYTVKNVGGSIASAAAAVSVNVVSPEVLTIARARCQRASNTWDLRGTSTVSTSNTVTAFNTGTVPATPQVTQIIGSAPVAAGAWQIQVRNGLPCTTPVSFQSTLGTKLQNVAVQVQ